MPSVGAARAKFLYCLLALALALFGLYAGFVAAAAEHADYRVYEAAVAAQRAGENPYLAASIERHGGGTNLSHVYPPLMTAVLVPLVAIGFPGAVAVYLLCLAIATVWLGRQFAPRTLCWWLGLAAFATTGFAVARWNLQTGNLGLLELVVFAMACVAVHRRQVALFALLVGWLGFCKILPLSLGVLLVPLVRRREAPVHALLWPLLAFAALHGLSYALFPVESGSWVQMLTGGAEGQHTPLHERTSGNNNPTFGLLLLDLWGLEVGGGLAKGVCGMLLAAGGWVVVRAAQRTWRAARVVDALPLLVVATLLCWPRLKPYGYGYAWVAVVVGAATGSARRAILLLGLCGALPALLPWAPNLPHEALQLLKRNHLAVLLLGAGLVLAWERSPREPAAAG